MIKAVLFDVGGVIITSPFESFARYEADHGLPDGFIRKLNSTNPDTNAWAHLERGDVSFDEFCELFEAEARAAGGELKARDVMECLAGEVRPAMLEAVRRCHERLKTAMVTNNWRAEDEGGRLDRLLIEPRCDVFVVRSAHRYEREMSRVRLAGNQPVEKLQAFVDEVVSTQRVADREHCVGNDRVRVGEASLRPRPVGVAAGAADDRRGVAEQVERAAM